LEGLGGRPDTVAVRAVLETTEAMAVAAEAPVGVGAGAERV